MSIKTSEFQSHFARFLLNGEHSYALESSLKAYSREELEARLSVYRNNVFHSLTDVLKDTFPAVASVVGEAFFEALCVAYIKTSPPREAAMIHYGDTFPGFIASFKHARELPYLADLAKLEWMIHSAYYQAEATPLPLEHFSALSNTDLAAARLIFHPSFALISSPYAIFSIHEFQDDDQQKATLNYNSPENVMVIRPQAEVNHYQISQTLIHFFELLLNKADLEKAIDKTLDFAQTQETEFQPSEAIAFLINSQSVISLS